MHPLDPDNEYLPEAHDDSQAELEDVALITAPKLPAAQLMHELCPEEA